MNTPHLEPRIERVRHELKRRTLRVASTVRLTPGMLRITLAGDDLADFRSLAPDDHVKLLVPGGSDERRDYTPRRHDPQARTLTIDFAVHDAGPATRWALAARPGDTIDVAGPRGSAVISDVERWLLIGDETALPAIGRHVEEMVAGTVTTLVAVAGPEEQQRFHTEASLTTLWVHRPLASADDPGPLLSRLADLELRPQTFVWIAAEAAVARAVRAYLVEERGIALSWTKTAGYWVLGKADAHEKFA